MNNSTGNHENIVLEASGLSKNYPVSQGLFKPPLMLEALHNASFTLCRGQTLAVVGESGCGKSTLARLVTMIETPTDGSLKIAGENIVDASKHTLQRLRSKVQIVFQNPYGSLNPRQKIGSALEQPLKMNTDLSAAVRKEKAKDMMERVGLRPEHYDRYPHMFSGGQRQRIAIARALMLDPEILVLDEPVSALDVSIQAQVLNLLAELQKQQQLAYLFISHDLSVVKHIADEVMVMYLGRPVEYCNREQLFSHPQHPYTQALLSATPVPTPGAKQQRQILTGEIPSPIDPPDGCRFHPRCRLCFEVCKQQEPPLQTHDQSLVACHAVNKPFS